MFPDREILMGNVVANSAIARGVFTEDELTWLDSTAQQLINDPEGWVFVWTELVRLRSQGLAVHAVTTSRKKFWEAYPARTTGWPYRSRWLARFSAVRTAAFLCIDPERRPAFAEQLRAHPFEAESLRSSHYCAGVINSVLAEAGGTLMGAPPVEPTVRCSYCRHTYEASSPVCPRCGAG